MSKSIKFILLSCFVCFYYSANAQPEKLPVHKFVNQERKVLLSQVASKVDYIKLETKRNCFIGHTRTADVFQNSVFVAYDAIYSFDDAGKFNRVISRKGRGPGEYIEFGGFHINQFSNELYFYNRLNQELIVFNLKGDLVEIIKGSGGFYFLPISKDLYCNFYPLRFSMLSNYYSIVITNKKGEHVKDLIKIDPESLKKIQDLTVQNSKMYYFKDSLTIWEGHNDTIRRISKDMKVTNRFILDLDKLKMPDFIQGGPRNPDYRNIENKYILIHDIVESENFLFIKCFDRGIGKYVLYDKIKKEGYTLKGKFPDNIDNFFDFFPDGITTEGLLYDIVQASLLEGFKAKDLSKNSEIGQLINNTNINDNPIIRIVRAR